MFGVDELNGLSPFAAANINSPQDLLSLIKAFFCAPKKDTRDCGGSLLMKKKLLMEMKTKM